MKEVPSSARQQGVALLQVLLLSVVITLLLLQLIYTARGQLAVTSEVEQRVKADLIMHSAQNEALFSVLITPGTLQPQALTFIAGNQGAVRMAEVSLENGVSVTTKLFDLSGLLPLRFPSNPLWRSALAEIGLEAELIDNFLFELTHMQDLDSEASAMFDEPMSSSAGFAYPNLPIQLSQSVDSWFELDPLARNKIKEISHHYSQATVNLMASPDPIVKGALGEFGARILEQSDGSLSDVKTRAFIASRNPDWIDLQLSGLWRVDVVVQSPILRRRSRMDFRLDIQSPTPFLLVGR